HATDGCGSGVGTVSQVSLERDNVFGDDGGVHELGTISGVVSGGMTVALTVNVTAWRARQRAGPVDRARGAGSRRAASRGRRTKARAARASTRPGPSSADRSA